MAPTGTTKPVAGDGHCGKCRELSLLLALTMKQKRPGDWDDIPRSGRSDRRTRETFRLLPAGGELILPLSDKMLLASLERCCPPGVYIWDGTSMSVNAGALDRGHKSFAVGPGAGKGG